MKFTFSWLKEYLDTTASVTDISQALTSIGLEVESVDDPIASIAHLKVVLVETCQDHTNSDHLHILGVNTGSEKLQIVCGAPNAKAGMKGILAVPGDKLPTLDEPLKKGSIRGVESFGMMCSERELGLGSDHNGIIELPDCAVVGATLSSVYPSDPVFDVSVTPNRGDCMSIYGIARDLSAKGIGCLKSPVFTEIKPTFESQIVLKNEALDKGCPIFTLREIKNVKNQQSPKELQEKLQAVGLRPISALVDVTNYFTIAFGRPLHVFDADKVTGDLVVRLSKDGEQFDALDGKTYTLSSGMVVISDDKGVQSLGGIMGGVATSCDENTTHVFLESAYFTPQAVAQAGQKLLLTSDARQRFERGLDPNSTLQGSIHATRFILNMCGGECSKIIVTGKEPDAPAPILFNPDKMRSVCGVDVTAVQCKTILEKLGCVVTQQEDQLNVVRPSWRSDISGSYDLVEEVLRIYGYDKLPEISLPRPCVQRMILTSKQAKEVSARRALAAKGVFQTVTWSFMSSENAKHFRLGSPLLLENPISSDLDELRPTLIPNLILGARNNITKGILDGGLFEIGPEFFGAKPQEQRMVACALRFGQMFPRHWAQTARAVDVFDAKSDAYAILNACEAPLSVQISRDVPKWYHSGRAGALKIGKTVLAYFGELHPKILKMLDMKSPVVACEVFLDNIPTSKAKKDKTQKAFKPFTLQPITRDLAFIAPKSVEAEKIVLAAKNVDKNLITDVTVFDLYEGERVEFDKKSIAIAVTIQPTVKTLTDEEIESLRRRIIGAVASATGAELRG